MSNLLKNSKGITLLEIMLSIVVGSIVLTSLMSVLNMTVQAQARVEVDNRLHNESYLIARQISIELFNLQVQSVQLIENSETQTVIDFSHEYDIIIGTGGVIERDYTNAVTERLVYDKVNHTITYAGTQMHSDTIAFVEGTVFELINIDATECDLSFYDEGTGSYTKCEEGVLKITLEVALGEEGESQTFVTTILI
jgi:type II secretory pathway pseudopilin PulG